MGSLHDIIEKEISVEGEHIFFIIELMKKKKKAPNLANYSVAVF